MIVSRSFGLGEQEYRAFPDAYDEMVGPDGRLRRHWERLLGSLESIGGEDLARRWEAVRRLIRENGVTFNVYSGAGGMDRPWQLDPVPVLIPEEEWESLEAGLLQRAQLLQAMLEDLYGEQILLREGWYPPELVFGHPGFLRPCHGLPVPAACRLVLYALDFGRNSQGQIVALRDSTQTPTGSGYALENRLVLARMLPEAFRDCGVRRLAPFFQTIRQTLASFAVRNLDDPRIVVLSPGPYSPSFFEHAYLAQYLGYNLVYGDDLTVRDDRVYLKLLEGLQPIDVIIRRLDDSFCDPLELRSDSLLGVPGLIQAVRSGSVVVANSLGSGVLETPALAGFLPELCRRILGEEPLLESVPTWWCGDAVARQHVLAHLDRMVIKPTFREPGLDPIFGEKLSQAEREELKLRIQAEPSRYVGQEQISLSTVPCGVEGRLDPRHVVTRAFLAAAGDGFRVMPGGLSRVSSSAESLVVSLQSGGGSKDTWVLSAEPVPAPLLQPAAPVELSRGGGDIPSRAADDLFWLGRYVERAEVSGRVLRGCLTRLHENFGLGEVPELPELLAALRPAKGGAAAEPDGKPDWPERRILQLLGDKRPLEGMPRTLREVRRVAGRVRDRISSDSWKLLAGLSGAQPPGSLSQAQEFLENMLVRLAAFGGMTRESMTRGHGWRFLDIGRRLERIDRTAQLLSATIGRAHEHELLLLESLVEIADCSRTYRRRYPVGLQAGPVLDLLLCDETNPRSIAYQLVALEKHLVHLGGDRTRMAVRRQEEGIVLRNLADVRLADVPGLCTLDEARARTALQQMLARLRADVPAFTDSLSRAYFTHLLPARQRLSPSGEVPR